MKGLLIKDFRLSFANRRVLYLLIAAILLIVLCGDESGIDFIVYFITAMCLMMVISTISYDEYDNGMEFLLTLPICIRLYVTEKYIFALLGELCGFLVSLFGVVLYNVTTGGMGITIEFLCGIALVCAAYMCVLSFMLPIRLKYGENGRIIALLIMGLLIAAGVVLNKFVDFELNLALVQRMNEMSMPMILMSAYVVAVIVVVISWFISVRIMEKKEF